MRDRESGTLWDQAEGVALEGPLAGTRLTAIPSRVQTTAELAASPQPQIVAGGSPRLAALYDRYRKWLRHHPPEK